MWFVTTGIIEKIVTAAGRELNSRFFPESTKTLTHYTDYNL